MGLCSLPGSGSGFPDPEKSLIPDPELCPTEWQQSLKYSTYHKRSPKFLFRFNYLPSFLVSICMPVSCLRVHLRDFSKLFPVSVIWVLASHPKEHTSAEHSASLWQLHRPQSHSCPFFKFYTMKAVQNYHRYILCVIKIIKGNFFELL